MPKNLFIKELDRLGWNMGKVITLQEFDPDAEKGVICVNSNFYPDGIIIGISPRSRIESCGETEFFIDDNRYEDIATAVQFEGPDILYSIDDWNWKVTKEWVITRNTTNAFVTTFDTFEECPTRKSIRG